MASVGGLFFMAGDNNGPADGGTSGDNTAVAIESLTIELNLSAPGTFGATNTAGGLFTVSSGVSAMGGAYVSGAAGAPLAHNVSTTGAEGRIGRITLDDIAVTNTSGLIDAPRHITVAGAAALANAAVIIADVGVEVKHLKNGVLTTTLNLSSDPFLAIFHGGAGDKAEIDSSESGLVIWIL